MTILLAGDPYDTSIKTMKIMSLSMVLGCYFVQSVNLILVNTPLYWLCSLNWLFLLLTWSIKIGSHFDVILANQHTALTHYEYLFVILLVSYLPSYLPSLLLKNLIGSETNELSSNYFTTRKYTQTIVNIVINSDMKYWLVSFPEELSSKVPNLVDMGLYSDVM